MSSVANLALISDTDMQTIQSVLFRAGYGAGSPVDGALQYSAAASLLMQKLRAGDRTPEVLERHLDDAYGRPTKYKVFHGSLLRRFAIQGLPR
jgi:hypothetical protein